MKGSTTGSDRQMVAKLLADLVGAQSINPPGNEACAAKVLSDFFASRGIQVRLNEVQPYRPNLIASIGAGCPRILLTSHLDVVGAGDLSRWKHDPFAGVIESGTLFGRGACDAKGSVAAMAAAIVALAHAPPCQIVLAAVAGEEKGGIGSKFFVARDGHFDAAIVGEPTQLGIATGQKGRLGIFLDFLGDSSHPTRTSSKSNPVFHLVEVMHFLRAFAEQVSRQSQGSFVPLRVDAGKENVLTPPERCSVTLSWWFGSTMNHADAIAAFQPGFDRFAQAAGITYEIRFHRGAGSHTIPLSHPLVATAARAIEVVLGTAPEVGEFPASCDMYVFGREGIPTIVVGPGDLRFAHGPNELIHLDEVVSASIIYAEIIKRLATSSSRSFDAQF